MTTNTSLLDPAILAKISNLALLARTVVEGTLAGLHQSPHRGASVEFAEHKLYTPGDEIRHIDWKAYGKSEKYYVKQFEEETNTRAFIVVDSSASMGYSGKDRISKLDYAKFLAASLAYLLIRQSDAVSLFASCTGEAYLPPRSSSSHLPLICKALTDLSPSGNRSFAEALDHIDERIHRRSYIVIIGDFLEDPSTLGSALRRLKGRGHDVIAFHIVDPDEIDFPFQDPTLFIDMEEALELHADPLAIRKSYCEQMQLHLGKLVEACTSATVDYARFANETPLDTALAHFLGWRQFRGTLS